MEMEKWADWDGLGEMENCVWRRVKDGGGWVGGEMRKE